MLTAAAALGLAAVGTYCLRAGSVRAFGARPVPPRFERALRHAAIGIMAALSVTSIPGRPGLTDVTIEQALGLLATVVAARRFSNLAVVIGIGVAVYALIGAVA